MHFFHLLSLLPCFFFCSLTGHTKFILWFLTLRKFMDIFKFYEEICFKKQNIKFCKFIFSSFCSILTWSASVNTVGVVDKTGVITEMSSYPQVLCIRGCWHSYIRSSIISTNWLPKCHHAHSCCEYGGCWKQVHPVEDIGKPPEWWAWLNSVIVADAYAHRTGLG